MKKVIVMIMVMLLSVATFGQQMVVDQKDLPPDLVQQLKAKQQVQQINSQLQVAGEWAGIGKEIGGAVREGLTAVKDVAVDFSKTDVGTFTMVLIAWKVIGEDAMGLAVGIFIFIFGVILISWSYRKTVLSRKICTEDGGLFKAKKYEIVHSAYYGKDDGSYGGASLIHGVAFFLLVGICYAIIF